MTSLLRLIAISVASLLVGITLWLVFGTIANHFHELLGAAWLLVCIFVTRFCFIKLFSMQGPSNFYSEEDFSTFFDDDQVTSMQPTGEKESMPWDDLQFVMIVTTDQGPWHMDVAWVLGDNLNSIAIPIGARGEDKLIERLQKLPGFDNNEMIRAMSCTDNNEFLVWRREDQKESEAKTFD